MDAVLLLQLLRRSAGQCRLHYVWSLVYVVVSIGLSLPVAAVNGIKRTTPGIELRLLLDALMMFLKNLESKKTTIVTAKSTAPTI